MKRILWRSESLLLCIKVSLNIKETHIQLWYTDCRIIILCKRFKNNVCITFIQTFDVRESSFSVLNFLLVLHTTRSSFIAEICLYVCHVGLCSKRYTLPEFLCTLVYHLHVLQHVQYLYLCYEMRLRNSCFYPIRF